MKTFRYGLSLAALVGAVGLVAPLPAQARTHKQVHALGLSASDKQAEKDANFVKMLLERSNIQVANSQKTIAKQDILVAREVNLQQYVPANAQQAQRIRQQFNKYAIQINQFQLQLNRNNVRLVNTENAVTNAINKLSGDTVKNPTLATQISQYLALAMQQAAVQEGEVEEILNRPPATPFVPIR